MRTVLYASEGYTTHDRRFLESATTDGRAVHFARFDGGARVLDERPLPDGVVEARWLGSTDCLTDDNRAEFGAAFRSLVTATGADLVHAGPVPTVGEVSASNSPVPVIVMSWASDLFVDARADVAVAERARTALGAAAHVLVDNHAIGAHAIALGAEVDRLSVVPWGVDLREFPVAPAHEAADLRPLRLLSLRSFEAVYDVATLIQAVSLVRRKVVVTVAGSGSLEPDLRRLARELEVDHLITWVGRVPEPTIGELLAAHDVHVSTSRSDGTSISLLQAMATGRPSVVTDIAPNVEWVPDEWRFAVGDADALAQLIDGIDVSELAPAGTRARTDAEQRADWDVNRHRILDLYETVS